MPSILKIRGYCIYFWSNENEEPIHVHIAKGIPVENATKLWITKDGGCIEANNNSHIPEKELKILSRIISANFFVIMSAWKNHFPDYEIKFYC
ncbi:MAG: DUF4160 domain-containing protein [Treponemataceae bacterium]|nr:DUF4160 domain-containing protein [Treponemataceae bacterium]